MGELYNHSRKTISGLLLKRLLFIISIIFMDFVHYYSRKTVSGVK